MSISGGGDDAKFLQSRQFVGNPFGGVERIVQKSTYGREQLLAEVRELVSARATAVQP